MDVQKDKRKLAALVAAVLLMGAGILYAEEPEEGTADPLPVPGQAAGGAKKSVRGLASAQADVEVRNPFSVLHETAAAGQSLPDQKVAEKAAAPSGAAPQDSPEPMAAQRQADPEPELCGILQSGNRYLAMLRVQDKSAALAVGESCQGWTVMTIDESGVLVQNGGQQKRLLLPR
ncbi:hypothetical protein SAMN02910356_02277 [Selenomonas sp. GACV-9]|uniref:hypothetical protein n=1 Tax=Selenomonas sp. GACV-9 TaxID=3158782 RepID=UPI0008F21CC9|nr:hypothetical protein SAMN02910356_02277 [Selenomonas ruminantium]